MPKYDVGNLQHISTFVRLVNQPSHLLTFNIDVRSCGCAAAIGCGAGRTASVTHTRRPAARRQTLELGVLALGAVADLY